MYKEKIIDVITNEVSFRDYTADEIAQIEESQRLNAIKLAEYQEKMSARLAVLEKLGLTEEEAKLLLG